MGLDYDDEDDEFRRQCGDCKEWSPPTRTQHTLISSRYGWRLAREVQPDGTTQLVWRCPNCHAKRRASTPEGVPPSDGSPGSSGRR